MTNQKLKNKALWIFPNFAESIKEAPREEQAVIWQAVIEFGFGGNVDTTNFTPIQRAIFKSLAPLVKLRNTGGSIDGLSNNPSGKKSQESAVEPNVAPTLAPRVAPTLAPTLGATVAPTPYKQEQEKEQEYKDTNVSSVDEAVKEMLLNTDFIRTGRIKL